MMNKTPIVYIVILAMMPTALMAQLDSASTERRSAWNMLRQQSLANPALMADAYRHTYSTLALTTDYKTQSEAFQLEHGTGHWLTEAKATSYVRLNSHSAVWGEAAYMNGRMHQIKWNSMADADLLYPDIMADSIGGDTHRERYVFSGGYASRKGTWLVGGEMHFRAEQEYRSRDPRMRSIVSDLTLRAGIGRIMGQYQVGAALMGNIYRQTADVDFYADGISTTEYQMTGLGTSYVRFSSSNRDMAFEGLGGGLLLSMHPTTGNGWMADLMASSHAYDRIANEYNSLPLTTLYRNHLAITVGRQWQDARHMAVFARLSYDRRLSDEHVAGTASQQDYPTLADLTMFRQHTLDAALHAIYGRQTVLTAWHLHLQGGLHCNKERYAYPERRQDYSHLYTALAAQWMHAFSQRWTLTAEGTMRYQANISSKIQMPYANMQAGIIDYVNHNFQFFKANYMVAGANVRIDHRLTHAPLTLFAQIDGQLTDCTEKAHEWRTALTLGIGF